MNHEAIIAQIERRAYDARVSIATVCKLAGVHPTTFSRWKRSTRNPNPIVPNFGSLAKLDAALTDLERPRRRRRITACQEVAA